MAVGAKSGGTPQLSGLSGYRITRLTTSAGIGHTVAYGSAESTTLTATPTFPPPLRALARTRIGCVHMFHRAAQIGGNA